MQLYIITRGDKDLVERFINNLRWSMLEWKRPDLENCQVGVTARPIQLWELAFPEECLDQVLGMVQPYSYAPKKFNFIFKWIRKLLGFKEINKVEHSNLFPIDCSVYSLGIKKDKRLKGGVENV